MASDDYLTVPEVAQELGITAPSIHSAMNEGRLPFITKYGRKLISRADLEVYRQRTRPEGEKPRGRPRKLPDTEGLHKTDADDE